MLEGTLPKIRYEIAQIEELLSSYSPLLQVAVARTPDLTEVTALAAVLHSFYNGIENIFGIVAKEIDQHFPGGTNWHRDLLDQMTRATDKRAAVIDKSESEILIEYLSFRHFFRHSYSFHLDWDQMRALVTGMSSNWKTIKIRIQTLEGNPGNSESSTT